MLNTIFNNFSNGSMILKDERKYCIDFLTSPELLNYRIIDSELLPFHKLVICFFIKLTMKISELTRMDETKEGEDKQKHSSYESVLACNLKQHYTGLFSYHSFCTSICLFSKHLLIITHRRIFSPSSESKD